VCVSASELAGRADGECEEAGGDSAGARGMVEVWRVWERTGEALGCGDADWGLDASQAWRAWWSTGQAAGSLGGGGGVDCVLPILDERFGGG
jgi:hypothetical protein